MRTRDVIGRTITHVSQQRTWDESVSEWRYAVYAITLDNGRRLILMANDDGIENYVTVEVVK